MTLLSSPKQVDSGSLKGHDPSDDVGTELARVDEVVVELEGTSVYGKGDPDKGNPEEFGVTFYDSGGNTDSNSQDLTYTAYQL